MSRLKEIRLQKGLTQEELSEKSGVKQGLISNYEKGRRMIGEDNMVKLIRALETNADYFLGLIDSNEKKAE
jgi:transcriptional regulator with XRE-family HTH domain